MSDSFIYVVYFISATSNGGQRWHKVGITSGPKQLFGEDRYKYPSAAVAAVTARMESLITGCPFKLDIAATVDGALLGEMLGYYSVCPTLRRASIHAERAIHRFLASEREQREWFSGSLTESVVQAATATAADSFRNTPEHRLAEKISGVIIKPTAVDRLLDTIETKNARFFTQPDRVNR